jgi:tRNA uridine 5-carboxymethylaminomethyl modification enzyme
MFTSRAEYRLLLREDNADLRLTDVGLRVGLASTEARQRLQSKKQSIEELMGFLASRYVRPASELNAFFTSIGTPPPQSHISLAQLLRRPEISLAHVRHLAPELPIYSHDVQAQVETRIKYEGYLNRQVEMIERFQKSENVRLPDDLDYASISGLSKEVTEKLTRIRPRSLGQASRISGITPAAISLLSIYLKKRKSA